MLDLLLEAWTSVLIEAAKLRAETGANGTWKPGRKLKLLFAAYNGARNTGEDVRVEEMVRQFRRVLGEKNVHLSVLTFDPELSRGYFGDAAQIKFPDIFPPFLYREVPQHDGLVACLGATFSKTFANATAAYMIGALGIASAKKKISVAYGGDAGRTDRVVAGMCRRYCGQSLLIMRNEESRAILGELGLASELGADTAWTFEPHPPEYGRQVLRQAGWDEKRRVLVVCPNNPFWWPVKPSISKYLARNLTGAYKDSQNRSVYFHRTGAKARAGLNRYVGSIANAVKAYCSRHSVFPVFVGMEQLDRHACEAAAQLLGGAPVFTSREYDMYQIVSIVRCADLLVSSRYHGVATSMPALVPSAGLTIDGRIRNLMRERGQERLLVEADDEALEGKLLEVLERLGKESEAIADGIGRAVVKNLRMMGRMGVLLERSVRERFPEFPVRMAGNGWEKYLPPLSPNLLRLMEKYPA
ncbi:MAG TPA: polysaccharide pyruvyl transferase family protein [Candidatus Acidoferrales bacterium]|nr:polysaccharide pyruvyl transferase family protein [Candidatus Acidoferrales bacterium]